MFFSSYTVPCSLTFFSSSLKPRPPSQSQNSLFIHSIYTLICIGCETQSYQTIPASNHFFSLSLNSNNSKILFPLEGLMESVTFYCGYLSGLDGRIAGLLLSQACCIAALTCWKLADTPNNGNTIINMKRQWFQRQYSPWFVEMYEFWWSLLTLKQIRIWNGS